MREGIGFDQSPELVPVVRKGTRKKLDAARNSASVSFGLKRTADLEQLGFDVPELLAERLNVRYRIIAMLGRQVPILPSYPAANFNDGSPTIETPPCAVSEETALLAQMNSVGQEVLNLFNLRHVAPTML